MNRIISFESEGITLRTSSVSVWFFWGSTGPFFLWALKCSPTIYAPTALMAFGSSWAALGPAGRNALYDGGALDSSLKNALFVLEKLLSQTCACVKYWGLS